MKRRIFKMAVVSVVSLLFVLLVAACSGETSESEGSSDTENSSNTEESNDAGEAVESQVFKMGHMNSTEHVQDSMAMTPFSEDVAELTGSEVEFEIYPGGALGGPTETFDNIQTGIMDAGWGLQGYNAGKFPVHSVLQLPFLAEGNAEELSVVAQKLYDEFPEIQEEYSDVKLLWAHAADPYAIITKDEAVRSFEDVKGLKLRTPSVEAGEMIESWGATPVSLPAPEIYDSLQKGVIDGGVLPVAAIKDFNLTDNVDFVTLGNFNTSLFYVTMNKDSWGKISSENQSLIEDELLGIPMATMSGQAFDYQKEQAEKESKEAGVEYISLPEEELQKFKDASSVVKEDWLSKMEEQGIDGQKIYDRTVELLNE